MDFVLRDSVPDDLGLFLYPVCLEFPELPELLCHDSEGLGHRPVPVKDLDETEDITRD